ncbi:MAG: hypothetical protein ACI841_001046 [Planctomycetota bacterium]|jgi:hypothetical protein
MIDETFHSMLREWFGSAPELLVWARVRRGGVLPDSSSLTRTTHCDLGLIYFPKEHEFTSSTTIASLSAGS